MAMHYEIREQDPPLPAGQLVLDSAAVEDRDEPAAELNPGRSRWVQPCSNLVSTRLVDNRLDPARGSERKHDGATDQLRVWPGHHRRQRRRARPEGRAARER